MSSVNKVILIGNIGREAEHRATTGGATFCNFSLATNEVWIDKNGQKQERTEWHRVVLWGKPADALRGYLTKGRLVYVEGSIQTREWTDREGNKRTTTEIRGQRLTLLGRGDGGRRVETVPEVSAGQAGQEPAAIEPDPQYSDEDIPF